MSIKDPFDGYRYRRDGTPYPPGRQGLFQWAKDFENRDLRRVHEDTLPNGMWVSTVWLGVDHNFRRLMDGVGRPLIFETMVEDALFEWKDYQERYSTETEAIAGHMETVERFRRYWYVNAVSPDEIQHRAESDFPLMKRGVDKTMPIGCRICLTKEKLRGSDLDKLPQTHAQLYEHLEAAHHIVVRRENETPDAAQTRFLETHSEALDCDECRDRGAPWSVQKEV
jgi:hypothetical protein